MKTLFTLLLLALSSLVMAQITEDSLRTMTKANLDLVLTKLKNAPADTSLRAERARRKVVKDSLGITVVKSPSHPQGGILLFTYPASGRAKQRRVEEAVIVGIRDCHLEPVVTDSLWTWALYGHREMVVLFFERLRDNTLIPADTMSWAAEDSLASGRWRKLLHERVDAGRF